MIMNELEALAFLSAIPLLGSVRIRLLIHHFGSAAAAAQAKISEITPLPGFGPKILESWKNWQKNSSWRENLDLVNKSGVKLIAYSSHEYPKRLLELPDFPILLYVKGDLEASDQDGIAIVGTRQASIYGLEMAEMIAKELASSGFAIVSGLARGIDTAAHRGALQKGRTLAIIGSGLSDIYPHENLALSEMIAKQGALISEFPMATPPDRQNFPQRNRIVSGLTLGTLLIEAPLRSGAMLTMERAREQKRKLFALPGRADLENFKGNHHLIKQGLAQLIESAQDIVNNFGDLFDRASQPMPKAPKLMLEKEEEHLLNQLPPEELSFDEILQKTKVPVAKLNVLLMSLVLKRAIKEFPGKSYKKIVLE